MTEEWLLGREGIDTRIVLPRPASLEVTVLDKNGAPRPHVRVAMKQVDPRDVMNFRNARCDDGGTCKFESLTPAKYRVQVVRNGKAGEGKLIDLPPGAAQSIRLVVDSDN